jgi:hypothetical protein
MAPRPFAAVTASVRQADRRQTLGGLLGRVARRSQPARRERGERPAAGTAPHARTLRRSRRRLGARQAVARLNRHSKG